MSRVVYLMGAGASRGRRKTDNPQYKLAKDEGNIIEGLPLVNEISERLGPKARPMQPEWVINIKQQVEHQGAAFFFKQWGTWGSDGIKRNKHANGKLLLGEVVQQMPGKKVC